MPARRRQRPARRQVEDFLRPEMASLGAREIRRGMQDLHQETCSSAARWRLRLCRGKNTLENDVDIFEMMAGVEQSVDFGG